MDVLSEVLKAVHLRGAAFINARFSAPWQVASPASASVASLLAPGADHLIIYHFITEGSAYARLDGQERIALTAGDILIVPHGHAHVLGSGTANKVIDTSKELPHILGLGLKDISLGGGGEVTRVVCGYLACERLIMQPLLACLPPLLNISIRNRDFGRWVEDSIRFLVRETELSSAGSQALLGRLSEVLFVEAIRRFIHTLPSEEKGWLAGSRDAVVGQSLMLLHRPPMQSWTIAELAKNVGVSRSTLAQRFTYFLGESPIKYLRDWRLRLSAGMLTSTSRSVLEIALQVGYDSEAAFNRVFKRCYGTPPAQYRNGTRRSKLGTRKD